MNPDDAPERWRWPGTGYRNDGGLSGLYGMDHCSVTIQACPESCGMTRGTGRAFSGDGPGRTVPAGKSCIPPWFWLAFFGTAYYNKKGMTR